jgi:ribonuclease E
VEIARQLKLRNIGGVIVVDFIDMESRRDQLQLLEHFTQALRDDSARPQVAQLTELGLVELTRKRQGQNIYELFGRACPSCGGLGHVAVLPGRDTLQPLATLQGLVRTPTPVRSEPPATASAEPAGGGRRRRGGRGRGGEAAEAAPLPTLEGDLPSYTMPANGEATAPAAESAGRRPEPDLVAVPMDEQQELVFGWLGLNPALLLDPPPSGDNLMVRVVRPGEDAESVLEQARQQLAASGSRRRRRGRGAGGESAGPSDRVNGFEPAEESVNPTFSPSVTITPLPVVSAESVSPGELVTVAVPVHRRTPATVVGATATAVAARVEEDGEASAEEPRRRRRRSSASV